MSLPPIGMYPIDHPIFKEKRAFAVKWRNRLRKLIGTYMNGRCEACGSEDMPYLKAYDVRREHAVGENRIRELIRGAKRLEEIPWYITVLCDDCAKELGWRRLNKTPGPSKTHDEWIRRKRERPFTMKAASITGREVKGSLTVGGHNTGGVHSIIIKDNCSYPKLKQTWAPICTLTGDGCRMRVAEWRYLRHFLSHRDPMYVMGYRQEQRVVARLKRCGWYAFRRRKSRPARGPKIRAATGSTGGEDVFGYRRGEGVFITCKTSATRVTAPSDHPQLCRRMMALSRLFGGTAVFCGRNAKGKDYFVRIDSGEGWDPK